MSLNFMYKFLLGFLVLLAPVYPVYNAMADDDDFEILEDGDDDADVSFSDSGADDITISGGDLSLNDNSGLVDVGGFDIAGIMLGMQFEDVYNLYHNGASLYYPRKKNSIVYTIPQDWKYNLDYECRQSGVVQPEKLNTCIRKLARGRGLMYVSEIHLERAKTGETIDVFFTSNATDNVVYRILYNNDADYTEGANPKFADQREKKILAFWKTVIQKYGSPNSGQDTWASSTNAYDPKMVAYYGALELVDEGRRAMDVATAAKQSREYFKAKPYAF